MWKIWIAHCPFSELQVNDVTAHTAIPLPLPFGIVFPFNIQLAHVHTLKYKHSLECGIVSRVVKWRPCGVISICQCAIQVFGELRSNASLCNTNSVRPSGGRSVRLSGRPQLNVKVLSFGFKLASLCCEMFYTIHYSFLWPWFWGSNSWIWGNVKVLRNVKVILLWKCYSFYWKEMLRFSRSIHCLCHGILLSKLKVWSQIIWLKLITVIIR